MHFDVWKVTVVRKQGRNHNKENEIVEGHEHLLNDEKIRLDSLWQRILIFLLTPKRHQRKKKYKSCLPLTALRRQVNVCADISRYFPAVKRQGTGWEQREWVGER